MVSKPLARCVRAPFRQAESIARRAVAANVLSASEAAVKVSFEKIVRPLAVCIALEEDIRHATRGPLRQATLYGSCSGHATRIAQQCGSELLKRPAIDSCCHPSANDRVEELIPEPANRAAVWGANCHALA